MTAFTIHVAERYENIDADSEAQAYRIAQSWYDRNDPEPRPEPTDYRIEHIHPTLQPTV